MHANKSPNLTIPTAIMIIPRTRFLRGRVAEMARQSKAKPMKISRMPQRVIKTTNGPG